MNRFFFFFSRKIESFFFFFLSFLSFFFNLPSKYQGVQGQTNDNFTKPFGVAVAFSGKKAGTAASFSWSTLNATTDYYVFWGQVSGGPYTKVIANSSRYDKSTQYHSIVSGLTPDTRYYYMVILFFFLSPPFFFFFFSLFSFLLFPFPSFLPFS